MPEGIFCGNHVFEFNDRGIVSSGKGYKSEYSWDIVKRLDRKNGYIYIYLDTAYSFIFPEKKLDDPDKFYYFLAEKIIL